MNWLNYHHLLYFWVAAREGSVSKAARQLRLAQPTISGQLRLLEQSLGEKLFVRAGRGIALTEVGRLVYRYADEIFAIGRELQEVLQERPTGQPVRFAVGIADVIPKLVAHRLLEPALKLPEQVRILCREDEPEPLLSALASHALDLVLLDAPVGPGIKLKVFNHLLGECSVSFYGVEALASRLAPGFPRSLDGAPILLPTEGTSMRRSLQQWFAEIGVRPSVVGEFDDHALLEVFGRAGAGIFPVPSVVDREVERQLGVSLVGRAEQVRERYFAVSAERRLKHPAVVAISQAARGELFA